MNHEDKTDSHCREDASVEVIAVSRDVADTAIRALRRDINFAHGMANYWYQKHGPFSSVDKGNAAQEYANKCEAAIKELEATPSSGRDGGGYGDRT